MKKHYILSLLAITIISGCHDDSSSGTSTMTCTCEEGKVCSGAGICYTNAACAACTESEVCVSGQCYDSSSACGKCKETDVCVNEACLDASDPCAQCEGKVCVSGVCYEKTSPCASCKSNEKCVGEVCYDANSACYACRPDQICNKDVCYESTDPCAKCTAEEVCEEGSCKEPADPCDACLSSDKCVDGECVPCANTICNGKCCPQSYLCDEYTHKCAMPCGLDMDKPSCNGQCCNVGLYCTTEGVCNRDCEFGMGCGPDHVCCGEDQTCLYDSYCGPKCDSPRVLCGQAGSEVCCDEGLVCYEGSCHTNCSDTQTRCGADQNLCCDNETDICMFNKCLKRGKSCQNLDDCELWEFCDEETSTCVDAAESDVQCIYRPPVGVLNPVEKWHYTVPEANGVVQTPMVINLTDDNGDGKIDENDIPDVVFIDNRYTLTAISGDDGHLLAETDATKNTDTSKPARIFFNRHNEVGAADIDNDGEIEVLAPAVMPTLEDSKLYAMVLKPDGNKYKWVEKYSISPHVNHNFGKASNSNNYTDIASSYWADYHPTIANLDGKDYPEVITTIGVIKGNDWSKWYCTYTMKQVSTWYMSFFSVADLDQDGEMEIINTDIYHGIPDENGKCQMILDHSNASQSMNQNGSGYAQDYDYVAVADMVPDDNDPNKPGELVPEIVRVRQGYVSVWKVYKNGDAWSQRLVWERQQSSNEGGGNPVIADFDGDGNPDIGVAGKYAYSVFNGQTGEMVWASKTQDASSHRTGSSVFDFEGDGVAEVIYRDEKKLRIYSGKPSNTTNKLDNGKTYTAANILVELNNTSGTVIENPVIVDVDNDGRTEIIVPDEGTPSKGITVYADANNNWVRTRRIWNQHAYHVTNINEDGTVPLKEEANWLNKRLNTYRANTQPADAFNAPNLQAVSLKSNDDNCPNSIKLTASIKNAGSRSTGKVWVTFYIPNYDIGNGVKKDIILKSDQTDGVIAPSNTKDFSFDWNFKGYWLEYPTEGDENTQQSPKRIEVTPEGPWNIMFKVDDAPEANSQDLYNECIETDNDSETISVDKCQLVIN